MYGEHSVNVYQTRLLPYAHSNSRYWSLRVNCSLVSCSSQIRWKSVPNCCPFLSLRPSPFNASSFPLFPFLPLCPLPVPGPFPDPTIRTHGVYGSVVSRARSRNGLLMHSELNVSMICVTTISFSKFGGDVQQKWLDIHSRLSRLHDGDCQLWDVRWVWLIDTRTA